MRATSRALAFATRWFDDATVRRVFEPLVADWQREWQDASAAKRWSVSLRGLAAFVCATVVSSPRILRQPTPTAVSNRIVTRIARFTLVATILLTLPYLSQLWSAGPTMLFGIPSGLVLAFPFAMIAAVDAIRCDHSLPPHVERATVTKLALAAMLFMLILGGFVLPASNQGFRSAAYERSLRAQGMDAERISRIKSSPYAPPPGIRELTTYQLLTDQGFTDGTRYLRAYVGRELNHRTSFAVLPVLLLWLRWRLLDMPRRRWSPLPPTVIAIAAFIGVMMLRQSVESVEATLGLPLGAGAWSPIVVISVVLFLDSWRRAKTGSVA